MHKDVPTDIFTYASDIRTPQPDEITDLDWDSPDFETLQNMTENVYQFAAAKNYHELRDLTDALRDGERIRSFEEFEQITKPIIGKYNQNWLRTEYNQAVASAQAGSHWNNFKRHQKEMPFLRYQCVMDGNTRPDHADLDGTIKRIDDDFWTKYMPPNGWGCRCEAVQLPGSDYEETPNEQIKYPTVPEMFQVNFGKQSVAFPQGHAYFKQLPRDFKREAKEMAREEVRRVIANAKQHKTLKNNPDYTDVEFDLRSGGVKATHKDHNFHKVGGIFEREVLNAGYKDGNSVILCNEKSHVIGQRFTEGLWNGKQFEVAGKQQSREIDYLKALKHCASKHTTKIAVIDLPNGGFDESILRKAMNRYNGLEKLHDGQYVAFERIIIVQNEKIVFECSL